MRLRGGGGTGTNAFLHWYLLCFRVSGTFPHLPGYFIWIPLHLDKQMPFSIFQLPLLEFCCFNVLKKCLHIPRPHNTPTLGRFEKLKNPITLLEFAVIGGRQGNLRQSTVFIVISIILQILLESKRWKKCVELEQSCFSLFSLCP